MATAGKDTGKTRCNICGAASLAQNDAWRKLSPLTQQYRSADPVRRARAAALRANNTRRTG